MSAFGVARPELLGLLLIAPLLGALLLLAIRARVAALHVFAGGSPLSARSRWRLWGKSALALLAFASVVIALAGPYVDLRTRGAHRIGVDLVVAIDVSQSMATRDVDPDRLRAARHVTQALGERMLGSRVSLVLFAGQGTVRYPATTDPRIVGDVLDNSAKGVHLQQGSSLAAAIESALGAFPADETADRGRAIVLVSDGEVTLGSSPDIATLESRGIRLFAVGVGTQAGGPIPTYDAVTGSFTGYLRGDDGQPIVSRLDENGLRQLATSAGGAYWRYAGDDAVIDDLAARMRSLETVTLAENAGSVPDEKSRWFVALACVALLLERFLPDRRRMPTPRDPRTAKRPARRRRILGLAIGSSMLLAVACGSDVARSIEDANARFSGGRYADALAAYRDLQVSAPDAPELAVDAGNALHMLGDLAHALPEYAHAIDVASPEIRAIAQYDRGSTLFRLGRLEDARDAYREALRLDPTDHDAKFDLEIVQRLIAQRRGQNGQPGQSGAPRASAGPSGRAGGSDASGPPSGSPQPGQPSPDRQPPTNDRDPGAAPPEDLRSALNDFRLGLTLDDALRVLDALDGQQRGVVQLLEGPRRANGQTPEY